MKYLLSFLIPLFLLATPLAAQVSPPTPVNQCLFISVSNAARCCAPGNTYNNEALADRCKQYYEGVINGPQGGSQQTSPRLGGDPTDIGAAPEVAPALQSCSTIEFKSLIDILVWLKCIIGGLLIPLIFSLAFLFFLWGVFKFMRASDVKDKQESQKMIWWGMLGLFIMVSVWGIIKIVSTTLGLDSSVVPVLQTEYLKR